MSYHFFEGTQFYFVRSILPEILKIPSRACQDPIMLTSDSSIFGWKFDPEHRSYYTLDRRNSAPPDMCETL